MTYSTKPANLCKTKKSYFDVVAGEIQTNASLLLTMLYPFNLRHYDFLKIFANTQD